MTLGQAEVTKIELSSFNGKNKVDIYNLVTFFDIYETILSPIITCVLKINDSIKLYETFPITGNEFIDLEFKTKGFELSATYRFKVVSITNREVDQNNSGVEYYLNCASSEIIQNSISSINKKYDDISSNMVKTIMDEYIKSDKEIYIEETKGNQTLFVAKMNPFKAIDFIKFNSVSKKYLSSAFVFFENQFGYYFTTIENLFYIGRNKIGDRIFTFNNQKNQNFGDDSFRNVLAFNLIRGGSIDSLGDGSQYNKTTVIDIRTGRIQTTEFSMKNYENNFQYADNNSFSNIGNSMQAKTTNNSNKIFTHAINSKNNVDRSMALSARLSYVHMLTNNITKLTVWGDNTIVAGQMITLKLPAVSGLTDTNENDKYSSGNYLVAKLRHRLINRGGVYTYISSMECLKGNYGEATV